MPSRADTPLAFRGYCPVGVADSAGAGGFYDARTWIAEGDRDRPAGAGRGWSRRNCPDGSRAWSDSTALYYLR